MIASGRIPLFQGERKVARSKGAGTKTSGRDIKVAAAYRSERGIFIDLHIYD